MKQKNYQARDLTEAPPSGMPPLLDPFVTHIIKSIYADAFNASTRILINFGYFNSGVLTRHP